MEMQYKVHKLNTEFSITDLVNVSYYTLSKDFVWSGESHEPWEMVYVDKGEVICTADKNRFVLKSGEMTFHKPNEFHNLSGDHRTAPNVSILTFECDSVAMKHLREDGYITVTEQGYIYLTDKGREIAETMYERHKLISSWLVSLGVDETIATEDACKMEHDISDETFEKIKLFGLESNFFI